MLVLSRKAGQSLVVDGDIRIVVTKIEGNRVRIGIEAPAEVSVRRSELRDAPQATGRRPLRRGQLALQEVG